ncbi:helix-turn-helix transcriptional regulator [Sporolactobacillus putidus]|uniref:Transcriptional regulator n=1 Tax=Sporolactobacillus putidus TaxID=492735 RepID=A0A917S6Y4_9BACL|nr:helix-turn-helix transcriptional regulator [Sporolactobacillus putidus]GGL61968.1 transcriptional regulator [Sporolactobacillus putidus]
MENNIYKYRVLLKMSQEELAKKCHVSRQTINAIENNKYNPSLKLAFNLSDVLNTSVDDLFIRENVNRSD